MHVTFIAMQTYHCHLSRGEYQEIKYPFAKSEYQLR